MLGGHVVQLERTAHALRDAGVEVDTSYSSTPDATDVDLVHGFGLRAADIRYWHTRGVPVALSTIYWDRAYRTTRSERDVTTRTLAGRGARAARFARAALRGRGPLLDASIRFAVSSRSSICSRGMKDLNRDSSASIAACRLTINSLTLHLPQLGNDFADSLLCLFA